MISIRKFLYAHRPAEAADELKVLADVASSLPVGPDMFTVYVALLGHIMACILSSDSVADLRARLAQARNRLSPELPGSEIHQIDTAIRGILTRYSARVQESAQRSALETQHIVGVLNQALSVVAGGGERSVSRLQKIQGALQRASGMQDMASLRASLSDAVHMVQEEEKKERETAARDLQNFGTEVAKARELVHGSTVCGLPGRPEGVDAIRDAMEGGPAGYGDPDEGVLVVAFVFSQLQGIVQRYGPDVVESLFFQLIRERIQPIAPSTIAFRWTPFSLVSLARAGTSVEQVKTAIAAANRAPLVHKVSLGNRTAVLKVGLAHLLLEGSQRTPASVIEELDGFTAAGSYKE